jgi:hypothetical protein
VVRIKKHYLKVYLSNVQLQNRSGSPGLTGGKRDRIGMELSYETASGAQAPPRPKYRRVSCDLWREACQSSSNGYDSSLPTLEEAALLFGYARGIAPESVLRDSD